MKMEDVAPGRRPTEKPSCPLGVEGSGLQAIPRRLAGTTFLWAASSRFLVRPASPLIFFLLATIEGRKLVAESRPRRQIPKLHRGHQKCRLSTPPDRSRHPISRIAQTELSSIGRLIESTMRSEFFTADETSNWTSIPKNSRGLPVRSSASSVRSVPAITCGTRRTPNSWRGSRRRVAAFSKRAERLSEKACADDLSPNEMS
jgi:hypothetical protein